MANGPLRVAIEKWWREWDPAARFRGWVSDSVERVENVLFAAHPELRSAAAELPDEFATLRQILTRGAGGGKQGGALESVGFFLGIGFSLASVFVSVFFERARHFLLAAFRPTIPGVADLLELYRRGIRTYAETSQDLLRQGLDKVYQDALLDAAQQLIPEGVLIRLAFRNPDKERHYAELYKRLGHTQADWDMLMEANRVIPGVQDLISMQVREAWNDEIAGRFEYDLGDRSKVKEWTAKQGLDPDWVDRYWRAHWQLPSVTMGIEMVHRLGRRTDGLRFDEGDLDLLMSANDIPPYFRKRILETSATLLTRVDLRRLYQRSLIDAEKVLDGYLKQGYSEEDAQALTEFAIQGTSEAEKDLTLAQITGAYRDGLIDRARAAEELVKMGYDEDESNLLLSSADIDIAREQLKEVLNYIKLRFQRGMIDEVAVRSELGVYGLTTERIEAYLLSWRQESKSQPSLVTQATAARWLKKNIITLERYGQYLKVLNYTDEDIAYYLQEAESGEIAEE